jgi:hypothetical protein
VANREVRANAGRIIRIAVATISAVNPNTAGPLAPHIKLGPKAPNGLPTTGFSFSLVPGGGSTPAGGGYTVTLWRWNPVAQRWQSFAARTLVNYDELYVTYDIDGGTSLFMQLDSITVLSDIIVSWCEE